MSIIPNNTTTSVAVENQLDETQASATSSSSTTTQTTAPKVTDNSNTDSTQNSQPKRFLERADEKINRPRIKKFLNKAQGRIDNFTTVHPTAESVEQAGIYTRDVVTTGSNVRRLLTEVIAKKSGVPARIDNPLPFGSALFLPKLAPLSLFPRLKKPENMTETEKNVKSTVTAANLLLNSAYMAMDKRVTYEDQKVAMAKNHSALAGLMANPENTNNSVGTNAGTQWISERLDNAGTHVGTKNLLNFLAKLDGQGPGQAIERALTKSSKKDESKREMGEHFAPNLNRILSAIIGGAVSSASYASLATSNGYVQDVTENYEDIEAEDPIAAMTEAYENNSNKEVPVPVEDIVNGLQSSRVGFDAFTTIGYYLDSRSKSTGSNTKATAHFLQNLSLLNLQGTGQGLGVSDNVANGVIVGGVTVLQGLLNEGVRKIKAAQFNKKAQSDASFAERSNPYNSDGLSALNWSTAALGTGAAIVANAADHEYAIQTASSTITQINNAAFAPEIQHALGTQDLTNSGGTNMLTFTLLDGAASGIVGGVSGYQQYRLYNYGKQTGNNWAKLPLIAGAIATAGQYIGYAAMTRPANPEAVKNSSAPVYNNKMKNVAHLAWIPAASWVGGILLAKRHDAKKGGLDGTKNAARVFDFFGNGGVLHINRLGKKGKSQTTSFAATE